METAFTEHIAARVTVYSKHLDTAYQFGIANEGFGGGSIPLTGEGTDLMSIGWGRQIGRGSQGAQAGTVAFVLPGRQYGTIGVPWAELISPNDFFTL